MHGCTKGAAEMKEMNIPVGVSDFEEIRKNEYYYIDKSELCAQTRASSLTGGMPVW